MRSDPGQELNNVRSKNATRAFKQRQGCCWYKMETRLKELNLNTKKKTQCIPKYMEVVGIK